MPRVGRLFCKQALGQTRSAAPNRAARRRRPAASGMTKGGQSGPKAAVGTTSRCNMTYGWSYNQYGTTNHTEYRYELSYLYVAKVPPGTPAPVPHGGSRPHITAIPVIPYHRHNGMTISSPPCPSREGVGEGGVSEMAPPSQPYARTPPASPLARSPPSVAQPRQRA